LPRDLFKLAYIKDESQKKKVPGKLVVVQFELKLESGDASPPGQEGSVT
jgi:hypothetical protein